MKGTKSKGINRQTIVKRRDAATIIAEKWGVVPDYVRKVIRGDRKHEEILTDYLELIQEDNKLIEAIRKAVPFN
jgi:hypothetical protein